MEGQLCLYLNTDSAWQRTAAGWIYVAWETRLTVLGQHFFLYFPNCFCALAEQGSLRALSVPSLMSHRKLANTFSTATFIYAKSVVSTLLNTVVNIICPSSSFLPVPHFYPLLLFFPSPPPPHLYVSIFKSNPQPLLGTVWLAKGYFMRLTSHVGAFGMMR